MTKQPCFYLDKNGHVTSNIENAITSISDLPNTPCKLIDRMVEELTSNMDKTMIEIRL